MECAGFGGPAEELQQERRRRKTISRSGSATPSPPRQPAVRPPPKTAISSPNGHLRIEGIGQRISFEDFVTHTRAHDHQIDRALELERRQSHLQTVVGVYARLLRTSRQVHGHLVECLRHGDKHGFVDILRTVQDLQESINAVCASHTRFGSPSSGSSSRPQTATLDRRKSISRLSPTSKQTIVELIQLVRTDPAFLTSRIRSLSQAQFSTLVSCPQYLDRAQSVLPRPSRYPPAVKRNTTFSSSVKERALSLERSSPFSALLFNAFSPCCRPDSPEAHLRLETWSSVCAELFNWSEHAYQPLIHQAFNAFAAMSSWRARPKVELFLMDLLQRGAFLLETNEDPFAQPGIGTESFDTLKTEAAQEFFDSAVENLFDILDDVDGGLPWGALRFGSTILGKLGDPEKQSRFRGFMFFQWFLCDYLSSAIVYPENVEAMLNYSICKDARDKILHQVTSRLQTQTSNILNRLAFGAPIPSSTRAHVEQMVAKLVETSPLENDMSRASALDHPINITDQASSFLLLSLDDIVCIVDTCFPRPTLSPTSWDQILIPGSPEFPPAHRISFAESNSMRNLSDEHAPLPILTKSEATKLESPPTRDSRCQIPSKDLIRNVDRLRRELVSFYDNGAGSACHPTSTQWTVFAIEPKDKITISSDGYLTAETKPLNTNLSQDLSFSRTNEKLDQVQTAVLKLVQEERPLTSSLSSSLGLAKSVQSQAPLEFLFQEKIDASRARADAVHAHFWWTALTELRLKYPLCLLSQDDTKVYKPLLTKSGEKAAQSERDCSALEENFGRLKCYFDELQETIDLIAQTQNKLRDKMWFLADVKNSSDYENARSVALALRNMTAIGDGAQGKPENPSRGRLRVRAFAGAFFNHSENQTINVMKAPKEYGGPKKLADDQINLTQKWLQRAGVENFCRGEERIHRFCVEVKTTSQSLIGENITNGPVLWSSDLFARERTAFNSPPSHNLNSFTCSRPSSIISEEGFQSFGQLNYSSKPDTLSRAPVSDSLSSPGRKFSFPSLSSERWKFNRDNLASEISSIGDSPSKNTISSGTESIASLWSPVMSHTYSATTAPTTVSRPSSVYHIESNTKLNTDKVNSEDKASFLNSVRHNLTALLLSDLSAPTWSCGSETDAWLWAILGQQRIKDGLEKRSALRKLLSPTFNGTALENKDKRKTSHPLRQKRSLSAGRILDGRKNRPNPESAATYELHFRNLDVPDNSTFSYGDGFTQLLARFSRCAGPEEKLLALTELHKLVVMYMSARLESSKPAEGYEYPLSIKQKSQNGDRASFNRRQSLNPTSPTTVLHSVSPLHQRRSISTSSVPTEQDVVSELKQIFMIEQPKTLFRDLQFISAFVSPEILNNAANGTAFLQVSLAALSLKEEVCQAMVDIADRTIVKHKRRSASSTREKADTYLKDAASFWVICAKEGNPVAQREVAGLYLSRPDLIPRVTMPLTMTRDCFRSDGLKKADANLCLALHWMRLSAQNGDQIAKQKLKEHDSEGIALA